ncbi:MAG: hypothetical protein ACREUU_09720 [Gammaproteobacteria bacterium]
MLSEQAYAALQAAKRSEEESLSQVILRFVPPPIKTFGDLQRHLEDLDGPVLADIDYAALRRLKRRKARRAH